LAVVFCRLVFVTALMFDLYVITMMIRCVVEYQVYPSLQWKPCLYEQCIVEKLLAEQFHDYIARVKETDCQAELRRLLAKGPPIWLADEHALPLDDKDDLNQHVCNLWFASDNRVVSAKLQGAVEGQEREDLWNELRQFIIQEGKEKGDDDDEDAEGGNKEAATT
jgi:hypothetical protein